jgi:hypothetical protein
MHSIIVSEILADDLRLTEGETELWDEGKHFLGAFVPTPGGPPGPEWMDDGSTWSRLTVPSAIAEKLGAASGEVKLRDPAGRLLGWFIPVAPGEETYFLAEIDGGASVADVLVDLKAHVR